MDQEQLQAELEATTKQLGAATVELEKYRTEARKNREELAKAAAGKYVAELVAKNPLAFGKTEAEKFASLYESAKVASLSETKELAEFATAQLAALEAYAAAKAPVAPSGETKPAETASKAEAPTAEDFRAYDRGDKSAAVKIDDFVKAQCKADTSKKYGEHLKAARLAAFKQPETK